MVGAAINMFMTLSSSKIWNDTMMILLQDRNVKVNVVGAAINKFMTLSSSKIWDCNKPDHDALLQ